ncbi:hypothetical protein ACFYT4_15560 [Streptomyces sp. NPDC004609]|uniref:hypothetical protein n=1 Tax=Streptomyces sp. NPDC004609 TaxID=3364704 RepID=UPI003694F725
MKRNTFPSRTATAVFTACLALGTAGALAGPAAAGTGAPAVPAVSAADLAAARGAATAPATLDTLSRFFARDGAGARSAAAPRAEGATVPVLTLSADFVAGKAGAPVARTEFLATKAVAPDGREASVWAARLGKGWQVVNIATGDDEFRYARLGAAALPGGTVFREPQIDAWYVSKDTRVLPLDDDAVRAVGAGGTTLAAYRDRVRSAYADKLPGSAYAKKGAAGGYGHSEGARGREHSAGTAGPARAGAPAVSTAAGTRDDGAVTVASVAAGAGAVLAIALCGVTASRLRRRG